MSSKSFMLPVTLCTSVNQTIPFSVDSPTSVTIVLFAPSASSFKLAVRFPNGTVLNQAPQTTWMSLSDSGSNAAPGLAWVVANPPLGNWTLVMTPIKPKHSRSAQSEEPVRDLLPNAFVSVLNEGSSEEMFSHLSTYDLEKDQTVGVVSRIARGVMANVASDVRITSAVLDVIAPDSSRAVFNMLDDGRHSDGAPGDGVYGGHFNASLRGQYKATAILSGFHPSGTPFARSTSHLMQVVHDDVELAASGARLEVDEANQMVQVWVPVAGSSPNGTLYRSYAELHADLLPVAWAGGYTPKRCDARGSCFVVFSVHAQWFRDAGVPSVFDVSLRHVTLYDGGSSIPVSQRASLRVHKRSSSVFRLVSAMSKRAAGAPAFEAMLKGPRPAALRPEAVRRARAAANDTLPTLVLVHGWFEQREKIMFSSEQISFS